MHLANADIAGDLNPPVEDYDCILAEGGVEYADEVHAALMALNGPRPLKAMADLLEVLRERTPTLYNSGEIGRAIAQHNWVDPVAVYEIGETIEFLDRYRVDIDWLEMVARAAASIPAHR